MMIRYFLKKIQLHLNIKTFHGMSQNAVFTQIWITICDYLLLIIALMTCHIQHDFTNSLVLSAQYSLVEFR